MMDMSRKDYFAGPRVDNINSLPYSYRVERELGGSRIYLYFKPESNYVMKISGKYALTDVALNTDLSLLYDTYYIEYLRYAFGAIHMRRIWRYFPRRIPGKVSRDAKEINGRIAS